MLMSGFKLRFCRFRRALKVDRGVLLDSICVVLLLYSENKWNTLPIPLGDISAGYVGVHYGPRLRIGPDR